MRSTQEQQKPYTSATSWKKLSTWRKSTSAYTPTHQAERAWQQGLDHQRRPSTSSSNTCLYNSWSHMTSWGLSRSTPFTTRPTSSPSMSRQRRFCVTSVMLASAPSVTEQQTTKSNNNNSFTAARRVNVRARAQRANIVRVMHTQTYILLSHGVNKGWQHELSHSDPLYFNMEYMNKILIQCFNMINYVIYFFNMMCTTWLWTCMATCLF